MSDRLPGVQSRVSTNPLLQAGIASTRKPIILGVGDVKYIVENERLVRGTGDADTVASTVYGSTTSYQLANVIRVGNTTNSADYSKTDDYTINGSGEIDWTSAVAEPTAGSEYYITYYKSVSNFDLTDYSSEGDIKSAHGDIYYASSKQFATVTAVASGSETTNFSWGNSETITTPADWTIRFTSGPNTGVERAVSAYAGPEFTTAAFSTNVSIGDVFEIENVSPTVNMLTVGSLLALRNGSQSVKVGQLDNTSFSDTIAPSGSEYSTALSTHLTSLQSDIEYPYFVVPMLPDNATTFATNADAQTNAINPVWNHAKLMSAAENKGERTCVTGFLSATTVANFKSFAVSYFSTRLIEVAPGDLRFADTANKTLNGSIGAAAWAGKYCSRTDFTSMLDEALVGITIATNFYSPVEQRELTSKGVSFLIDDAGVTKVVASKTTNTTNADTEDPAIVSIADHLNNTVRIELRNTFLGQAINSNLIGAIGGKMSSIFETMITDQILEDYDATSITVAQDASAPRQINVTASVSPQYSLWWIDVTMQFTI